MSFNILCILVFVNFGFYQSACDLTPPIHGNDRAPFNYASNTPFLSEPDMESFIRNEWRDYPTMDLPTLMNPLKEILYTGFNPNQTKIRVCSDLPFSTFKDKFSNAFQPDQVYVNTPSLIVPLKYFRWAFELMTILNDDSNSELRDAMVVAMRNLDALDKDGDSEMVKFMKNCQATVIVPHLFKSNYCVIGPIIEWYFPALTNVSLIRLGDTFLRYNSVKKLVKCAFHEYGNGTVLNELENIPISGNDHVSFENLQIIVDSFEKNLHSLYLKIEEDDDDGSANQTAVPLSHWAIVYDALNTDVGQYLKLISSRNGLSEYENLPWINYRQNTTDLAQNDTMFGPIDYSKDLHKFDYCAASRGDTSSKSISENRSFGEMSNSSGSDSNYNSMTMPLSASIPSSTFSVSVEKNDFSTGLNHPIVGQTRISPHQRLFHHVGQIKNKNYGKIAINQTAPFSIFTPPFSYLSTDRSPYTNSWHLRNSAGASSRIGSSTASKPYRTNIEDTELKKTENKFADLINEVIMKTKSRNSKSAILDKGATRDMGRTSIQISDQLVSSVRKNYIQPTTASLTDSTLIEELENNFDSSRVRVRN